jgi:large repetitive protein
MRRVLVLIAVAGFCTMAGAACQPPVRCGSVITKDTKLTSDLVDCRGKALIINASGITVDLGGHTVSSADGIGLVSVGHDQVTIRNGTVRGATTGVSITDAVALTISNVAMVGGQQSEFGSSTNQLGLRLNQVRLSDITSSSASGFYGIAMRDSDRNWLDHVTSRGDADTSTPLRTLNSDRNTFADSAFTSAGSTNAHFENSHYNTILRVNFSNSNSDSLALVRSNHNTIRASRIASEATGLVIWKSTDNLIEDNISGPNPSDNIFVIDSARTTLRGNDLGPITVTGSVQTRILDNVLDPWWGSDGIFVAADSTLTTVLRNHVNGFQEDGIDVDAPDTVLQGNVANGNGEYGIEAVAGVTDRGGNRASGNGEPAQCLNVQCTAP